jgi:hypothetical protein
LGAGLEDEAEETGEGLEELREIAARAASREGPPRT